MLKTLLSRRGIFSVVFLCAVCVGARAGEPTAADVVVYGASPSGICAAVQAARMGKRAVLIEPGKFIGGMVAGGLGATDKGVVWTVGGLAREFFENVYTYYLDPKAWTYETRAQYLPKHGQIRTEWMRCQWYFEPHVATEIFNKMLSEAGVTLVKEGALDRKNGVLKKDGVIESITLLDGRTFKAAYFIDASYEGDLMAAAGVSYCVGRESRACYGESFAGVRALSSAVLKGISPYVEDGKPESGLLPRVLNGAPGADGEADHRTQAYNFRMCLTNVPENRVRFEKPEHYDSLQYEILYRMLRNRKRPVVPFKLTPMPNLKTDSNNALYISTDFIGGSHEWPEASYAERAKILEAHKTYVQGFFWFLQNDPRVPEPVRAKAREYGLAKDEFVDNGNWPTQLYVREARRMIGEYVMNQNNFSAKAKGKKVKNALPEKESQPIRDSVAVGSYALDCHAVCLFADKAGNLRIEGNYGAGPKPYAISYRSLLPKASECKNLLVTLCFSSSHIAYGSMRMEPVYMELGQAAATAVALSMDKGLTPYTLPYADLRARLLQDKAVLDPVEPEKQ